ncbi:Calmodulin-like protein 4 [Bienertia sinuspersici]
MSTKGMDASHCKLQKASLGEVQLRKIFREHDVNGDGHLNKEELKDAFRRLGAFVPSWRADRAIYYTDIDIDGVINEDEIDQLVAYAIEYAKVHYGTSLSNVDWLHGGAESLLTLSNLFVVLGLRKGLREPISEDNQSDDISGFKEENVLSMPTVAAINKFQG